MGAPSQGCYLILLSWVAVASASPTHWRHTLALCPFPWQEWSCPGQASSEFHSVWADKKLPVDYACKENFKRTTKSGKHGGTTLRELRGRVLISTGCIWVLWMTLVGCWRLSDLPGVANLQSDQMGKEVVSWDVWGGIQREGWKVVNASCVHSFVMFLLLCWLCWIFAGTAGNGPHTRSALL